MTIHPIQPDLLNLFKDIYLQYIDKETLINLLKCDQLAIREEKLWDAVVKWTKIKIQSQNRGDWILSGKLVI